MAKLKKWSEEDTKKLISIMEDKKYSSRAEASQAAAKEFRRNAETCSQKYYDARSKKRKVREKKRKVREKISKKILAHRIEIPEGTKIMNKILGEEINISSMEIFPDRIVLKL